MPQDSVWWKNYEKRTSKMLAQEEARKRKEAQSSKIEAERRKRQMKYWHEWPESEFTPALKAKVMERDDHKCVSCGLTATLCIHHLRPQSLGGKNRMSNLVILCAGCHSLVHYTLGHKVYHRKNDQHLINTAKVVIRNAWKRHTQYPFGLTRYAWITLLMVTFHTIHQELPCEMDEIVEMWKVEWNDFSFGISECVKKGLVYAIPCGGFAVNLKAIDRSSEWKDIAHRLEVCMEDTHAAGQVSERIIWWDYDKPVRMQERWRNIDVDALHDPTFNA